MSEQEKVELEQVPLKSDTDAPAGAETEAKPVPPKKTWFFKKVPVYFSSFSTPAKKPAAEGEATAVEIPEEKPKKCWWSRKCGAAGTEEEQKEAGVSIGIDLVHRDENHINEHVKFGFEDIFGEPDTTHSFDAVWRLVHRAFTFTRCFFYRLFALIIALPAAIIFGLLFAIFTALNTFVIVPVAKLLTIPGAWLAKAWNYLVHLIFDPLARAIGLIFSSVSVRRYGINSDTTADLIA